MPLLGEIQRMESERKTSIGACVSSTVRAVDSALLAVCALLLLAGPAMALQELSRAEDASARAALTGEAGALEPAFRTPWRVALLLAVVVAGVLGTLLAMRIARQPKVRAVSGRLLLLLLLGMTLLDLAYLADGRWFMLAPHGARAVSIVWLYPIAAVLIAGSVMRLAEVEEAFAEARARG